MEAQVKEFQGEYRFLSNFWPAEVTYGKLTYPSVEHAFQAAKTKPEDSGMRLRIHAAATAGIAKRLGKLVDKRSDWEAERLLVMEDLVRQKFSTEPLRSKLLATGNAELIEGNYWHDTFWGVCKGAGQNHLGKIIMKIRKELQDAEAGVSVSRS